MNPDAALGVLIPTRNSAALLPDHIAALSAWIDLAEEVVVVDSFSNDGTVELLQKGLQHPHVRFLSHPPGLYASWNAGIRELKTPLAYISTIGDTITRDGVLQLLEAARTLAVDVVLSTPECVRPDGSRVADAWPVADIIRTLKIHCPRRLAPLEGITFACLHATRALTGSCASTIYRRSALQRFPFPTEFGTAGDGAWCLRHVGQLSWGVVPGTFSTFLLHPNERSQSENKPQADRPGPDHILRSSVPAWLESGLVTQQQLTTAGWDDLLTALTGYLEAKAQFDQYRRGRLPWILSPNAWRTRARRSHFRSRLRSAQERALQSISKESPALESIESGQGEVHSRS